jgi:O-antigen/teichoic acid export membrane protein
LAISRSSGQETIGIAAAAVSFASNITTVANLWIPLIIEMFLGRTIAHREVEETKVYVKASFYLLATSLLACTLVSVLLRGQLLVFANFDSNLLFVSLMLIISSSISTLFRGIIISMINTKGLAFASIASTIAKFCVALILLSTGVSALGITIGIASFTTLETLD